MKINFYIILIASIVMISCSSNSKNESKSENTLNDTIQTESGLQYYYIKHGDGRKVEYGCEVGTYLSLMVEDSVVWNTDSLPDKQFPFIAGYTRLIKGFTEVTMLLREGDEIVAILPDSLAYGAKGAGDIIPPHATLVYDKFKVVKVDEPKSIMFDFLLESFDKGGMQEMLKAHNRITTTKDSVNYHRGNDHISKLCDKLNDNERYEEAKEVASHFIKSIDGNGLRYRLAISLEGLGQIDQAIDILKIILSGEPDNSKFKSKFEELNNKILIDSKE